MKLPQSDDGYYEDDEVKEQTNKPTSKPSDTTQSNKSTILICCLLFAFALFARLYFLFVISHPDNPGAGWFGDSYHHWQIGYLTKEIGLNQSFLRLWDLKGMEYFWGILHPLVLVLLFSITGNSSMALERSMTSVAGSITAVLLYLIVKKYWNNKAGIAAGIFAAFCATSIFNDVSGMIEPLGIPFILAGIYFWQKKPLLSGLMFGIAILTRSEFWIFTIGLIAAFTIFDKKSHSDKKVLLYLGFALILIPYMKYLLDYTANPIYPFYQNFLTNIYGTWQFKDQPDPDGIRAKFIFKSIFFITVFWTALCIWKRPKGWQFYLLGLGNWLFLGATLGLSAYAESWRDFVWVVRFMLFPYAFLGAVLCIVLFYYIPKKIKLFDFLQLHWIILLIVLSSTQLAWHEIYRWYTPTFQTWEKIKKESAEIAKAYQGGGILLPEGNPEITYALVQFHKVQGRYIISQMFDPYYYFEEKHHDPYQNWNAPNPESKEGLTYREEVVTWIKKNNIRYIVTYASRDRYIKLFELEKQAFKKEYNVEGTNLLVYSVSPEEL